MLTNVLLNDSDLLCSGQCGRFVSTRVSEGLVQYFSHSRDVAAMADHETRQLQREFLAQWRDRARVRRRRQRWVFVILRRTCQRRSAVVAGPRAPDALLLDLAPDALLHGPALGFCVLPAISSGLAGAVIGAVTPARRGRWASGGLWPSPVIPSPARLRNGGGGCAARLMQGLCRRDGSRPEQTQNAAFGDGPGTVHTLHAGDVRRLFGCRRASRHPETRARGNGNNANVRSLWTT